MMNLKYPLILASKSPRRQALLREAGFSFSVKTKDTDERFPATLNPEAVAKFLALKKAEAFKAGLMEDEILLTADTVVIVDDHILEKPSDAVEAADMLGMLSGRSHRVISGSCLLHGDELTTFDDTTEVHFRRLSAEEIKYYIDNFKPFDKAGAYGIQEWIGMIGIEKIIGSYYTVMGLPVHKLYLELRKFAAR